MKCVVRNYIRHNRYTSIEIKSALPLTNKQSNYLTEIGIRTIWDFIKLDLRRYGIPDLEFQQEIAKTIFCGKIPVLMNLPENILFVDMMVLPQDKHRIGYIAVGGSEMPPKYWIASKSLQQEKYILDQFLEYLTLVKPKLLIFNVHKSLMDVLRERILDQGMTNYELNAFGTKWMDFDTLLRDSIIWNFSISVDTIMHYLGMNYPQCQLSPVLNNQKYISKFSQEIQSQKGLSLVLIEKIMQRSNEKFSLTSYIISEFTLVNRPSIQLRMITQTDINLPSYN